MYDASMAIRERTTLSLDRITHQRIKRLAEKEGKSMGEVVDALVEEHFRPESAKRVILPKLLNYNPTGDPLTLDQIKELSEDWA